MSDTLIRFERDGSSVNVFIDEGPMGYQFVFKYTCGSDWSADLLKRHYHNKLTKVVESIRKEEYDRGYKDGRAKKAKATWFSCLLKKVNY